MNRENMKQILIDQKEMYLNNSVIHRNYELEDNVNYCFVGIRRTGKSYMLYQQIKKLIVDGVSLNQIAYVNFEDERLLEVTTDDLNMILEVSIELSGTNNKPYLFLDEIQNVDAWEKFVRRLSDMKYRVNITGSNSKMLSSEIASTLGGRFMIVQIFPYSFKEYLTAKEKIKDYSGIISTADKAEIISLYNDYVKYGAFPELVEIRNKREYLSNIYQTIYLGDIIRRNKITNDFAVRLILKKIAESVMHPISYNRLTNIIKSTGIAIGKHTVINYMGFMLDSYLLFKIQNYSAKLVDKETMSKYYFMDTGLLGLLIMDSNTAALENLVAIELIRRYSVDNVFYYENNAEIDFYVPNRGLAMQVSYSLLDNPDTKARELGAFVKLKNFIPDAKCIVITNSEEAELEYDEIKVKVIPMWKWMLE